MSAVHGEGAGQSERGAGRSRAPRDDRAERSVVAVVVSFTRGTFLTRSALSPYLSARRLPCPPIRALFSPTPLHRSRVAPMEVAPSIEQRETAETANGAISSTDNGVADADAATASAAAASSSDATATPAPAIHSLAAPARSLISSDQLITGPASLVRELLDNALDAGATNIALQLTNDGTGSNAITGVEARDNGCGVPVADRDMLGRPHSTSKLRSFDQLSGSLGSAALLTRGFRGEALFFTTQCAARVEFCTKTSGDTMGARLVWVAGTRRKDLDAPVAMAVGSTVRVQGLFHNRPVRLQFQRKESQIAAQAAEIMEMLRSYAFVHPTVRFLCNNPQFNKPALAGASAASAAATDWALASGLTLFRASIPLIIGTMGGLANMMELSISATDIDNDASAAAAPLRMEGFITKPSLDSASSASAGSKELVRSKGDRIFFYVERNRPCNLPWLAKILVAEWRTLSVRLLTRRKLRTQGIDPASLPNGGPDAAPTDSAIIGTFSGRFPMVLLKIDPPAPMATAGASPSISSPSLALDLNRSPDKRDVILGEEVRMKRLLGELAKQALHRAFQSIEDAEQAEFAATRPVAAAPATSRGAAQKPQDAPVSTAESKEEAGDPILTASSAGAGAVAPASSPPHSMVDDAETRFPPIASVAAIPPSQESLPKLERMHDTPAADDDEIEILSSQIVSTPHSFKASQAVPVTSSPRVANRAGSTVDFSSFARPLPQPQSFMGSNHSLSLVPQAQPRQSQSPPRVQPQSALPVVPMDPMSLHMAAAAASSSVASAPSHSSPKRARVSAGKAASSSASSSSPLRQSQLNVVDPENASIHFSARSIEIDAEWMQQLDDKFLRIEHEEKETTESPQVVGHIADKDLFVVRVAPTASASASVAAAPSSPSSSFPTLRLFSAARASESLLFSALLSSYALPSVPLDAAIPVDDSFPGLDAAQRTKLQGDVQRALELQATQAVPAGCISFVKAMALCGFELVLDSAAGSSPSALLHLVSVPSQSSITIEDFLSTLRTIWADPCFQACGVLRIRRDEKAEADADSTVAPGSQPSAAAAAFAAKVSAFAPNTNWRVDGIQAAIAAQATASRKGPSQPLHTVAQATKLFARLQRAVAEGIATPAASQWSDVQCPHSKPVASPPLVWITAVDL